jgi:hypothetical protein
VQFGASERISIEPVRVRHILTQWFAKRQASSITFKECIEPKNDPNDDYVVAYEAIFEPSTLDQTRLELWVTTEGCVAIGIETRKRIAERIGVKCWKDRFAAGHEPCFISESALFVILDLIADGKVLIIPSVIPLFGLISSQAAATHDILEKLVLSGYPAVKWIKIASRSDLLKENDFLLFRPWN